MAQPLAAPYSYFADANGLPLAGGKVYTYAAGTTTPQNSYTDSSGATPAANPIVLDSAGRATIWLSGSYKIVVKDSLGNQISSTDNISTTASTNTELDYLSGVTPGTSSATKAVVLDSSKNFGGLATNTFNTASTNIANMAAVQGSLTGGFVNKFRNAKFDIANRGTSGSVTTGNTNITVDGWYLGATGATATWSQFLGGDNAGNYGSILQITGNASLTDVLFKQRIESTIAADLANKTVTVQFTIYNNSAASLTPTLTVKHATAQDNWGATGTDVSAVSLQAISNNTAATVAYTYTSPTTADNGVEVTIDFGGALNTNGKFIYISRADIRPTPGVTLGLNATPPVIELRPISQSLPESLRYLPALLSSGTASIIGFGSAISATVALIFVPFPAPARAAATGITVDNATHMSLSDGVAAPIVSTAIAFSAASQTGAYIQVTVAAGLTQYRPYECYFNNASGSLIFTGAEL